MRGDDWLEEIQIGSKLTEIMKLLYFHCMFAGITIYGSASSHQQPYFATVQK